MFGFRDVTVTPEFPATDFITLAEAKAYCGITDSASDAFLNGQIPAISQRIEAYCNALFATRTIVEKLYPEDAVNYMMLTHYPVTAVTSVKYGGVAQTLSDFQTSAANGTMKRVDKTTFPTNTEIEITYTVGRSPVIASVKQAALDFAKALVELQAQDSSVAADSVADVGSTTYARPTSWPKASNGMSVPPAAASALAMVCRSFVA